MADDLYQEFFLSICEIKDDRMIEAKDGGYLEVFCVGIINNIWRNKDRVKTYSNGNTSPIYCMTDGMASDDVLQFIPAHEEQDITDLIEKANKIIEQKKESLNPIDRYQARVFCYVQEFRFIKEFAKKSKIPYNAVLLAHNTFQQNLKKELCRIL